MPQTLLALATLCPLSRWLDPCAEEQRYEQRFGFLEQMCRPELLPYPHYRSSTDPAGLPPARVLAVALSSFQRAGERAGGLLAAAPLRALLREEQVGVGLGRGWLDGQCQGLYQLFLCFACTTWLGAGAFWAAVGTRVQ